MKVTLSSFPLRTVLLASLAGAALAAHAASGYWVNHNQEALVTPGMTQEQVQAALGHPDRDVKYISEPGRTYSYRVRDASDDVFEIDFTADGKVAAASERLDMTSGGHGGHR